MRRSRILIFLLIAVVTELARGEESDGTAGFCRASMSASNTPSAARMDGTVRLGNVLVDAHNREVRVPGWVNMTEGAIELLACGPGGKTHESVFVLDVNPLDLQTGLLLLGLKPGIPPTGLGEGCPSGTSVDLFVEWNEDGQKHAKRAESFVFNYENQSVLPSTPWVFTGSVIEEGQFKALAEESLIATYWDPWAVINIPLPCGSNDEILAVHRQAIPPLKTPITMRIVPHQEGKE